MRLIDADALIDELGISDEDIIFEGMLVDAPTIDAVPATIDGALGYLHKVGWIQEHDRIMTEDVAPVRHGYWYKNDQDKLLMKIRCSICNKAIYSENHFAYCPNCGARMDGGNDEID